MVVGGGPGGRAAGMPVWLRTLLILVILPAWLATVGIDLYHGVPPPMQLWSIPLGLLAATSTPGILAEIGRRLLRDSDGEPPPQTTGPTEGGGAP
jgi:hypothetical protein